MTRFTARLVASLPILALALSACGDRGSSAPQGSAAMAALEHASAVAQPPGWADDLAIAPAEDLNPDPHVLEFNLEAKLAELEILPGHEDHGVDVQRQDPGAVDPRPGRRPRDRALQELAARGDDDPLARPARAERHGRRARRHAGRRSSPAASSPTTSRCATRARTGTTRTSIRRRRLGAASTVRSSSTIRTIRRPSATTSCCCCPT